MINVLPRRFAFDSVLATAVFGLAAFGLVMISSVSVYDSYQVYSQQGVDCGLVAANCNDFYFWRQARNLAIALPLWLIVSLVPYLFWRKMALTFFLISILLLIALFLPGFSTDYGTSRSWLTIPILNSIQPAELAKLGLIFYLARWMEGRREMIATFENGFLPFAVILGIVVFLLMLQPDFGTTFVMLLIAGAIYFVAGANVKHILGAIIATILFGVIFFAMTSSCALETGDRGKLCYIHDRLATFLDPTLDPERTGFQVKQSLIAVGKGGFFGDGLEGATQRFGYLPEVQSDAIYAALSESFGFLGSLILAGVFLFIAYRGFKIAEKAPDRFGQLIAVGLSVALAGQAFTHIGVNLALLPYTGITLPFLSYGGSSLVASFLMAGILLNISKYTCFQKASFYREKRRRVNY